jgi:hypothetical protein
LRNFDTLLLSFGTDKAVKMAIEELAGLSGVADMFEMGEDGCGVDNGADLARVRW